MLQILGEATYMENLNLFKSAVFSSKLIVFEDLKQFFRICNEFFKFHPLEANLFCIKTAAWIINPEFGKLDLNSLHNTLSTNQGNF